MTELYNLYIQKSLSEKRVLYKTGNDTYISEIAFINTNNSILELQLFNIEFEDSKYQNGLYLDNNNYLMNFINQHRKPYYEGNDFNIKTIDTEKRYYTYIRVLKDIQNPQLEGKMMIFYFGYTINNKVQLYLQFNKTFENIFQLNVKLCGIYFDYNSCNFINTNYSETNLNLDITKHILFETINLSAVLRKEKLKNINKMIEDYSALYNEIGEWAKQTFPNSGTIQHINKLKNEIEEVIKSPKDPEEYADCLIALFAGAYKSDLSFSEIINAVVNKMEINKKREWTVMPDGTHQHI